MLKQFTVIISAFLSRVTCILKCFTRISQLRNTLIPTEHDFPFLACFRAGSKYMWDRKEIFAQISVSIRHFFGESCVNNGNFYLAVLGLQTGKKNGKQ